MYTQRCRRTFISKGKKRKEMDCTFLEARR
jgi:hypothetical protein